LRVASTPNSDWYWRFTALKAEILVWQGMNKEALELLQQDLPPSLKSSDTAIWRRLSQSSANMNLSNFPVAAQCLAEAHSLALVNHTELLGYVALREGTLADLQGDAEQAADRYRLALRVGREQKDKYLEASSLGSLGILETEDARYGASVDWNREGLRIAEDAGIKSLAAKIQLNTGWSYFELGDFEEALNVFQGAQEAAGKVGLVKDRAVCQANIGAVEYYQRDYPLAERDSLQALQLARNLDERRLVTEISNTLSNIEIVTGQLARADEHNREALELSRSTGDHAGEMTSMLVAGRIEAGRKQYHRAEELLTRVIHDPSASAALRWEVEARLAKVYDEENQPGKAEQEYKRSITTIQTARRSIQEDELRLAFLSSAIDFYDDYVDFLMQHHRVEDALRIADLTRSQTLVEGLASSSKSPAISAANQSPRELARKLHATLLIYWLSQNHSYLWVVTPAKVAYFPLPAKSQIDPTVKSYRQAIIEGQDVLRASAESGEQLYTTLVAPAQKLIPQNSRVILFPAESLYGLNFETLIVPSPTPHFWIEDVTLSTASALAMPPSASQQMPGNQKSLLLVGNPEPASPDFPRLAQAPAEIQKISNHFSQANRDVLEGTHATPGSYLSSNPGQFSYLHFVTHGTASHTRPLESAVILSKEGDSYKLYARDIVQHPLTAELVTISACNGAGTRAYAGEGLVGLSWAFLRAGAHNVIGALWEVSDASSTPQLMDAMYGGIDKGQDPATALRNAKLAILHASSASVFKKPFYWAPFQLYTGS
jgi:CHAT domain-containing protein